MSDGDTTFQLADCLSFIPRAGVGYRNYGDFTGPVSRDELVWRVSGRLRWQWTETLSVSAVVGHDRFASDNKDFDAERTEAGVVFAILYYNASACDRSASSPRSMNCPIVMRLIGRAAPFINGDISSLSKDVARETCWRGESAGRWWKWAVEDAGSYRSAAAGPR